MVPISPMQGLAFIRAHLAGLVISATVCLVSLALYTALYLASYMPPFLRLLADVELRTLDLRFRLRGVRQPESSVVIVAIDQKSQDILGRWPFPRNYLAQAVDFLRKAGARVVAFDINFSQPDQNSALQALHAVRSAYQNSGRRATQNARFEAQLRLLEADADNDQKFADAVSRFDNAVLGYFFLFSKEESLSQNRAIVSDFVNYLSFQAYPQVANAQYGKMFEGREAEGVSPNLPSFARQAKNFGFFNVLTDSDGTVRREPVIIRFQQSFYPSLDVAAALAYTGYSLDRVRVVFNPNGLERIDFGPVTVPTDPEGFVYIDYHGPAGLFPTYSLADVVHQKLPPGVFRDRLVLIGPTATGIGDMVVTPFQSMNFPGVEVHANFIDNLLSGHFIRRGPRENLIDIAFILIFSVGAGILLSVVSPGRSTVFLILVVGSFLCLAQWLFTIQRTWIAIFLPLATLAADYAGVVSYRFFFEEREKRRVRRAFQQYLPPGVVNQLLQRPDLLRLGGEEKNLTAMFCDIRNFTTLSEGLSPADLVTLLNEYLSEMTEVIFLHWGTLDKYIGDAIMAFWGAPYPQADHALRCCRAGLEMLQRLKKLQAGWEAEGRPKIDIGMGINTGPMLVGNMGSKVRFNFTIMGDNVNLASRLEGLNKQFGTRIIVSESTYQPVAERMVARELDLIRVKGKTRPVKVFELLGLDQDGDEFRELVARFQDGLEAYRSRRWQSGIEIFERLLEDFSNDNPSRVFLQRCREFLEQPPDDAWDGIYVMKAK